MLQPRAGATMPYATTTDAAGHFLLDEVDAGGYVLTAYRPGYTEQSYSPQGDPKHWAILTLDTGQKLKELVFKLMPEGVISGRILDADGDPLAGATVACMRFRYVNGKRRLNPYEETSSDDLGEFRLRLSMAGKGLISATHPPQTEGVALERP